MNNATTDERPSSDQKAQVIAALNAKLDQALDALGAGQPLSWDVLTKEQVTDRVQLIAVRLLAAGAAGPALQMRLSQALEAAQPHGVRKMLSVRRVKSKDWKKRMAVCEAYFWAIECTNDEVAALEAAYEAHWGKGALASDRVPLEVDYGEKRGKEGTNGWKFTQLPTLAACRFAEQTIPMLREGGFLMSETSQLLTMLDLPKF